MTPDQLARLVLERRFGALTPPEAADLSAALDTPESRAEAARIDNLLDHAPSSATTAKADFSGALAMRIDAAAAEERGVSWGRVKIRALAAYAGIAAGALLYAGWNGWFTEDVRPSGAEAAYSAALELPGRLPR